MTHAALAGARAGDGLQPKWCQLGNSLKRPLCTSDALARSTVLLPRASAVIVNGFQLHFRDQGMIRSRRRLDNPLGRCVARHGARTGTMGKNRDQEYTPYASEYVRW